MATFHILNGDCLAENLKRTSVNQNFIVFRECLIDGPVNADSIADFWAVRADYMAGNYNTLTDEYFCKTVKEINKLSAIAENSQICLWFENDLFCQVNMWFLLSIFPSFSTHKFFRIFPAINDDDNMWKGFGIANIEQLEQAYYSKVQFSRNDFELGKKLWKAYQKDDFNTLMELSQIESKCFKCLEDICQAHIDRFPLDQTLGRPEKIIKEILDEDITDFYDIFLKFSDREGIYGFGDLQFKRIYDRLFDSKYFFL